MRKERLTDEELAILLELYNERAGIMEFCGNMSRAEAEERAWIEVYGEKL